nr:hypothetical protein [Tanacetum cinerariifolium]
MAQPACIYKCSAYQFSFPGIITDKSLHRTEKLKKKENMSKKSAGSKSATKVVEKSESSQPKPHLFLDQLEVDVTGTIAVMIGRVCDVNAITERYLSMDFFVSDSKETDNQEKDKNKAKNDKTEHRMEKIEKDKVIRSQKSKVKARG